MKGRESLEIASSNSSPEYVFRVLVAEDSTQYQKLLAESLEGEGLSVTVVADGRACVDAALGALGEGRPFDVILVDVRMPELDGYSAALHLRERGLTQPIISMSSKGLACEQGNSLQAGCNHHIRKTDIANSLIPLVHECLEFQYQCVV